MGALLLIRESQTNYDAKSDLRSYSREHLIESASRVVKIEHAATVEAIRHFAEINRRNLFLDYGFSSLFDMLTRYFGYCRASAQVRINSMRLMNDVPEVEKKIEAGELTLTAASQVQSFLSAEKKEQKAYTPEQKLGLIETCSGKSTREVERELAARNPQFFKKESVRAVSVSHSRMNISIRNDVLEELAKVKALLSHCSPNMSYDELLGHMAKIALDKLDPERKAKRYLAKTRRESIPKQVANASRVRAHELEPRSRYVNAKTKHAVWLKNESRGCEFVSEKSGQICGSKQLLQIDHIKPFFAGGSHHVENLRVLCAQHNRWRYKRNK